jgi:hypothetical protein
MFKKLFTPIHPTINSLIKELDINKSSSVIEFEKGAPHSGTIIKKDIIKVTNFRLRLEYIIGYNPGFVSMELFSEDGDCQIPLNATERRALEKAGDKLRSRFIADYEEQARAVLDEKQPSCNEAVFKVIKRNSSKSKRG